MQTGHAASWFLPTSYANQLQLTASDMLYYIKKYLANFCYWIVFGHPLSPFRKTRTCIHTPGTPPLVPEELTKENLASALDGADIVYFDVRLHETALLVAEEVISSSHIVSVHKSQKKSAHSFCSCDL